MIEMRTIKVALLDESNTGNHKTASLKEITYIMRKYHKAEITRHNVLVENGS
jgi:hypothetical protein